MINFKEIKSHKCILNLLNNADKIDGLRFAVDPKHLKKSLQIINIVKKKYRKLSFNINLMYLSRWYNQNNFVTGIIKTINKFNKEKIIDVLTFVDSFGAMTPEKVNNFFHSINEKKLKNINIGCHFHNNCNLALANALVAINNCQFVDLTFLGFGRGAGNAETELFLAIKFAKNNNIKDFTLDNLIEKLQKMKDDLKWGSSFAYAFAASNGFSQSEIMDLIVKRRLSPATAANILGKNDSKSRFKKTT